MTHLYPARLAGASYHAQSAQNSVPSHVPLPSGRLILTALLAGLAAACSPGHAAPSAPGAAGRGLQVVELFQSQGCSSCPPANANVMALADRPGVLTLSWQVTYWDYLGWKDSFAQSAFTQRQRDYAVALRHDGVFTPQVVINGLGDLVGMDRRELDGALGALDRGGDAVLLRLSAGKVQVGGSAQRGTIYLVRYDPHILQIPIKAGENGGRTLPHRNVVREFVVLGHLSRSAQTIALPAARRPDLKLAVLVQADRLGPVLAAVRD